MSTIYSWQRSKKYYYYYYYYHWLLLKIHSLALSVIFPPDWNTCFEEAASRGAARTLSYCAAALLCCVPVRAAAAASWPCLSRSSAPGGTSWDSLAAFHSASPSPEGRYVHAHTLKSDPHLIRRFFFFFLSICPLFITAFHYLSLKHVCWWRVPLT